MKKPIYIEPSKELKEKWNRDGKAYEQASAIFLPKIEYLEARLKKSERERSILTIQLQKFNQKARLARGILDNIIKLISQVITQ